MAPHFVASTPSPPRKDARYSGAIRNARHKTPQKKLYIHTSVSLLRQAWSRVQKDCRSNLAARFLSKPGPAKRTPTDGVTDEGFETNVKRPFIESVLLFVLPDGGRKKAVRSEAVEEKVRRLRDKCCADWDAIVIDSRNRVDDHRQAKGGIVWLWVQAVKRAVGTMHPRDEARTQALLEFLEHIEKSEGVFSVDMPGTESDVEALGKAEGEEDEEGTRMRAEGSAAKADGEWLAQLAQRARGGDTHGAHDRMETPGPHGLGGGHIDGGIDINAEDAADADNASESVVSMTSSLETEQQLGLPFDLGDDDFDWRATQLSFSDTHDFDEMMAAIDCH